MAVGDKPALESTPPINQNKMGRFRQFVVTHDRWLSIVGAGLVLVTFVFKDAKRDELKELLSALDSAQSVFALRKDLQNTQRTIDLMAQRAELIEIKTNRDKLDFKPPPELEEFFDLLRTYGEAIEEDGASYDVLRGLVEKLPDGPVQEAKIDSYMKRTDELVKRYETLGTEFDIKEKRRNKHQKAWKDLSALGRDINLLSAEVQLYEKTSVSNAKVVLKNQRHRLEWYTRVSYGTFGLGWFLGLIGKICGVKTAGDMGG